MNQDHYKPSKYLVRKLEDILSGEEEEISYAVKVLLQRQIEKSSDTRKEQGIVLGNEVTDSAVALHLARNKGVRGLSSGFRSIDKMTKGFVSGEVTIISARTSVGKTMLALNIAKNVVTNGTPVLFVTLEMTQAQLMERYITMTGGLKNKLPTDEYHQIAGLTFMQEHEKVDPNSIDGIIKNATDNGAGLVVLDHLHYFSRGEKNDDTEKISKELSRTAKKYNVPIIAIAHTRKYVGTGSPKDTTIDDIRGASFISQDADIVLMLNRDGKKPDELRVKVWKNRNAGIDYAENEVELSFDGNNIREDLKW